MRIISSSSYIPSKKISNKELEESLNLEKGFIEKRTGIKNRNYIEKETIEEIAINAVNKLIKKTKVNKEEIGLIIVATTSTDKLMPSISNYIQKNLKIENCICFDILAGCSGYINAIDIAEMYIDNRGIKKAIVVGVDILSRKLNLEDPGTAIILADGAGATLLEDSNENKYYSKIEAIPDNDEILKCNTNGKIYMDGIAIYKYAVTETVKNINKLLNESEEKIENIKYIIPHQSNIKIIMSIANKLKIDKEKIYTNIENLGNTFCASIPIVLEEMEEKKLLQKNDKIVIIGYGAGLNTGSIFIEI